VSGSGRSIGRDRARSSGCRSPAKEGSLSAIRLTISARIGVNFSVDRGGSRFLDPRARSGIDTRSSVLIIDSMSS
jgi:hypothetical protein